MIKSPINRKPGLVVALPEGQPDIELSEFGPSFIIGRNVQALPFSQESRVESRHSFRHLQGVLLVQKLGQFLLCHLPLGRERMNGRG